ncbi:mycothiol system anti-sigma-R factor [Kineosporia rhizophila]|uniref:mycothiol system anti-sigma-R factor n=1 Tax=Kineosporia TaxID=49184 RepID=UPI000A7F3D44|nr:MULTISPECIES: mycothiol system anti-sigma-R factor [Kineosporia]MCE0539628.1 mycothiol system anti-sigma-R factor [Kineosporia rhizophila]GLY17945.1 anti-sigma factor RsrA [Kineosporia sp. NBRC 101677]
MSVCGEPDCSKVLAQVYEYLDGELGEAELTEIRHHLDDCSPCLRQYDLDVALKALVRRSCQETAPADLRDRIMVKITEVRIELNG